ncbi:DNA polymerase III subunit gamma/tau [Erythrobacter sp. QSSC1-22B]|uniref:DNA polymerase III subunit gamma/tau n=1 Tax=Erythrobacter sp. QSSC1-22B TaxID=1860125 RepID=UPI0008050D85|nr:DNA polymerase III subunit gamma/tau [Erythrobacter sp. QSSC1-22B]OBX18647.1 DNA polymerase III subunit gamma/tau [Erythrobacter sp. QSSC1-22B]
MGDSPDKPDGLPWESDPSHDAAEAQPSAAEREQAGQEALFGAPAPAPQLAPAEEPVEKPVPAPVPRAAAPDAPAQPYRVLARKYRPQTFSELIGQEPMVRTLANAIARDRLAHAFLMTGVRGVGKTSTARLIAKALNCIGPDGNGGPTIDPCGVCEPCVAIAEGRHIDVIEMDAASHTGVDDVREIIEAVRYSAVSARYKIYIVDEVHMLSRNAFNALLKTLEEPPAHVKFLFATTEVEKLPVTVLSRTQRFDLRRIPAEMLQEHFALICTKEGVTADAEALSIIANAAEGSVRDGLSILDQAIAHADMDSEGRVTAERVRSMLGLADKSAQRRLLAHLLAGEGKALLAGIDEQYALGVEPLAMLRSLMDIVHRITVAQVSGGEVDAVSAEERAQLGEWATAIPPAQLHRLWQLLLKGYDEVRSAPDPLVSARMALLRALHAQELPDPGRLARLIEDAATRAPATPAEGTAASDAPGANAVKWEDLVARVEDGGQHLAAGIMRLQIRPIAVEDGLLRYARDPQFRDDIVPTLREALATITGTRWLLEEDPEGEGSPSIAEREEAAQHSAETEARAHPLVQAALAAFPGAEIIADRDKPPVGLQQRRNQA